MRVPAGKVFQLVGCCVPFTCELEEITIVAQWLNEPSIFQATQRAKPFGRSPGICS